MMADYNNNPNLGQELDWDAEIEESSGYTVLEPGDYPFTVANFERKRFKGSPKMCACNMIALTLEVDGVRLTENLYFNSKAEWKISEFLVAIGMKQKGVPCKIDWNRMIGSRGVCKVGVRHWTGNDGKEHDGNEITHFYAPDEPTSVPAPAAPATPAYGAAQSAAVPATPTYQPQPQYQPQQTAMPGYNQRPAWNPGAF